MGQEHELLLTRLPELRDAILPRLIANHTNTNNEMPVQLNDGKFK